MHSHDSRMILLGLLQTHENIKSHTLWVISSWSHVVTCGFENTSKCKVCIRFQKEYKWQHFISVIFIVIMYRNDYIFGILD